MAVFIDQLNREVHLPQAPKRIISLVPSQTELLFDLALENEVIGITKFCVHPQEWFQSKTRIGGTKDANLALIQSMQPDLIIANKEENAQTQIEEMAKFAPVWVSDIATYQQALSMIEGIGMITNRANIASKIKTNIETSFHHLKQHPKTPKVAYLIWKDPYMSIGADTFIHDILEKAGYQNVYHTSTRYPEITLSDLQQKEPDLVFLSSEPYPFKLKHIQALQLLLPHATIQLVDGEMFSWYGSRLQKTAGYLNELLQTIV